MKKPKSAVKVTYWHPAYGPVRLWVTTLSKKKPSHLNTWGQGRGYTVPIAAVVFDNSSDKVRVLGPTAQ
jgi:hypothetical protein